LAQVTPVPWVDVQWLEIYGVLSEIAPHLYLRNILPD
jgi:hypothetical protein